jgi:predicted nucleic acid-binding protein
MQYLDTSVLVAFYLPERMSAKVQKHLSGSGKAAISSLSEVEFHSAVARRVRMNDLAKSDALKVLSQLRTHVDEGLYRMVPVEQHDYVLARDWLAAFDTPLRTLDALHLAVAFSNDFVLVTADRVFAECATRLGIKCITIR